jgi:hypothetical protein
VVTEHEGSAPPAIRHDLESHSPLSSSSQAVYVIDRCWLADHFQKSPFDCVFCYNCCHCNAVKEFWALWDNIYDCVFTTLDFPFHS